MASPQERVPIPGSERTVLPGARAIGVPNPNERIQVTVLVRPRRTFARRTVAGAMGARLPQERRYLSRRQFEATYGADPADLAQVEAFAQKYGLDVVEVSPARRSVVLAGTVAALSAAFGVKLVIYESPQGNYRGRTGPVYVPAELAPIAQGVFGLDDRPQARPRLRRFGGQRGAIQSHIRGISYTPLQLARLYDFPNQANGQGQCIAIIELGGGYRTADLDAYFTQLEIPTPKVSAISVDHGHNQPTGDPNGPDGEVMLDIEIAGALAPSAHLAVYFAPNTDQSFLNAITTAIHDDQHKPSVISISWGAPESDWTPQALQAFDQAFQEAAALGVTVCCASGDGGSADGVDDGLTHVDFPASSPHVLGCGGTRLESSDSTIIQESVWNDGPGGGASGGGISDVFPLPLWQSQANIPPSANPGGRIGRGVPDVAGEAAPATGYRIQVDGQQVVFGGTSAVAPLWAGLIARINQRLGQPVGYLNPLLYNQIAAPDTLHDIANGNNGAYQAGPGWDACTGLGSPDGAGLLRALSSGHRSQAV